MLKWPLSQGCSASACTSRHLLCTVFSADAYDPNAWQPCAKLHSTGCMNKQFIHLLLGTRQRSAEVGALQCWPTWLGHCCPHQGAPTYLREPRLCQEAIKTIIHHDQHTGQLSVHLRRSCIQQDLLGSTFDQHMVSALEVLPLEVTIVSDVDVRYTLNWSQRSRQVFT